MHLKYLILARVVSVDTFATFGCVVSTSPHKTKKGLFKHMLYNKLFYRGRYFTARIRSCNTNCTIRNYYY